jgi:hypothetical protein
MEKISTRPKELEMPAKARDKTSTPDQYIGRGAVIGAAVGVTVIFPAVLVLGLAVGAGAASAVGLGLVAAFWGGLGLGAMEGAVAAVAREERREAAARREASALRDGATVTSIAPAAADQERAISAVGD